MLPPIPEGRRGTARRDPVRPCVLHGIFRISVDGGPPTRVTEFDVSRAENSHRFPSFLPDGHHFIYTVRSERAENWGISIASLDNPKGTVLTVGTDWRAEVVPPDTCCSCAARASWPRRWTSARIGSLASQ